MGGTAGGTTPPHHPNPFPGNTGEPMYPWPLSFPCPLPFRPAAPCPLPPTPWSLAFPCPSLDPFLPRSVSLRTVHTMLALAAFYLSRTLVLRRTACVSTLLAPPLLLSFPLAAVPLRRCATLLCLPYLSPHPTTGLPAALPPDPSGPPWRPDPVLPGSISNR